MNFWYVEYKAYGKIGYMDMIEAKDGKEAIDIVKSKVIGAVNFKVMRSQPED